MFDKDTLLFCLVVILMLSAYFLGSLGGNL